MSTRRAALKTLLRDLRTVDAQEDHYRLRMLELCDAEGDPFSRDYYEPGHFTASGFVLSPGRGALLLILHAKLDLWLQPGGHVEPQDGDLEHAARREVQEETGLRELVRMGNGIFDVDVHPIPAHGASPAHEHFDVRFLFLAPHLDARALDGTLQARWVPLAEVATAQPDRSVMRAVEKLERG